MSRTFTDRRQAGRLLAGRVGAEPWSAPTVVALPRGGVPVGHEVARTLRAPFDVLVARKLGAPGHPELGVGAIAEGGVRVLDTSRCRQLGVPQDELDRVEAHEHEELARRVHLYRGDQVRAPLTDREVILVDDGLATGVTAEAALRSIRAHRPRRLVLAVPVAAADTALRLTALADDVLHLICPDPFHAVGEWYDDFSPTTDDEVLELLHHTTTAATW